MGPGRARETRQPIHATSRDRLSSDTLEEMEARLTSRAARILIAIATVLPRVCAGEAQALGAAEHIKCSLCYSGSAAVRSSLVGISSIIQQAIVDG